MKRAYKAGENCFAREKPHVRLRTGCQVWSTDNLVFVSFKAHFILKCGSCWTLLGIYSKRRLPFAHIVCRICTLTEVDSRLPVPAWSGNWLLQQLGLCSMSPEIGSPLRNVYRSTWILFLGNLEHNTFHRCIPKLLFSWSFSVVVQVHNRLGMVPVTETTHPLNEMSFCTYGCSCTGHCHITTRSPSISSRPQGLFVWCRHAKSALARTWPLWM